jgi:hypothetical protein
MVLLRCTILRYHFHESFVKMISDWCTVAIIAMKEEFMLKLLLV